MYVVVEYSTLLALTTICGSVLLGFGLVCMAVQEGFATVWRASRKIGQRRH